jgi:hypothetical protein
MKTIPCTCDGFNVLVCPTCGKVEGKRLVGKREEEGKHMGTGMETETEKV